MIGVARELNYTPMHRNVLGILASQVAASVQNAQRRTRSQEMVDTLVNLRAGLVRAEKERLVNEERAKSAVRVERADELSVDALLAVSVHARSGQNLTEFYQLLGESVAGLVEAAKGLFWGVGDHGIPECGPGGVGGDEGYACRPRPGAVPPGPRGPHTQTA